MGNAIKIFFDKYSLQILAASLGLGVGLRWIHIGRQSFWYDESFSGLTARLNPAQILSNAALDVHPPGYYLILHYWIQLGQSEAMLRSLSALFSLVAIVLIYGLGRWLFDRSVAALAALGLAIIPFQVYFAQEARMYGLVVCLATALTWLFLNAVTANTPGVKLGTSEARPGRLESSTKTSVPQRRFAGGWLLWVGFAFLAAFGLYVHYFFAFLLLGLYCWFFLGINRRRKVVLRFGLANGLIALLFLPQLRQALLRTEAYLSTEAWQAVPNVLSPLTTIYYLLFTHRSPIWLVPISLFLIIAALILTFWESWRRASLTHSLELALWFSVLVPIVIVIVVSWLSAHSIYVERSFAVASPALVLLLARGATAAPRRSPTPYLVALLILPIVVTLTANILTPDPAKPPVREAAQTIGTDYKPGDISLHLQDASGIPALWYTPEVPHLLVDVPGSSFIFASTHRLFGGDVVEWPSTLTKADRLWLTVMPGFTGPEQLAVHRSIAKNYPLLMKKDWGSVQLYLYDLRGEKL